MPVIDEADVVVVLPPPGRGCDALLEQGHPQIGTARTAGIRFGQEDGAEAIRHVEVRIERRGEIEKRIEQFVPLRRVLMEPVVAVVLQRAHPVHVRQDRAVGQRRFAHQRGRLHVQHLVSRRALGIEAIPLHPHRCGQGNEHDGGGDKRDASRARRHLKSRRMKIIVANTSRATTYVRA